MNRRREPLIEEDSFLGPSHRVEAILGEGGFGVVAKCRNIHTNQSVAIKVNKPSPDVFHQAREEIDILKKLRCLDPETSNIVSCQGFFFHQANICLTFELLDLSLKDYIEEQQVPVTEMRSVLGQMSSALSHLSSIRIVHSDIKPDNIMVVDRNQKPLKVKLIDFGLALPESACKPGVFAGTLCYMAPEMTLLGSFNEAIDMWSLGQTAVELITGSPLYNGNELYDIWRFIIETQGQPEDHVLDQGEGTEYFFTPQSEGPRRWRLKTPEEMDYMPRDNRCYVLDSLDDLEECLDYQRGPHRDHHLLVDLIKKMLCLDQEQRIKPLEVLQHPFLSESPPQSSWADLVEDLNNSEESESEEDQEPSEDQTAGLEEKYFRVQTVNDSQAEESEDEETRVQTETPSQAEEPEDVETRIQTETTSQAEEPEDVETRVQIETTSQAEEPEDVETRVQTETTSQPEELEDVETRIKTETNSQAEEPEDVETRIQTETTSQAEEPEDVETRIQTETTSQAEEPEDVETRVQIETTSQAEEPEDVETRIQTETTSQAEEPEDVETRVQTETTSQAEEPEDVETRVQTETTSQSEELEDERIQEEEVQPESRKERVGWFRRVLKNIRNAFRSRFSGRSRRRS